MTHVFDRKITDWPNEQLFKVVFYNLKDDNGLTEEQILNYIPAPWQFVLSDVKIVQEKYDAIVQEVYISAFGYLRFRIQTANPEENHIANAVLRLMNKKMLKKCMICGLKAYRQHNMFRRLPLCIEHKIEYANFFHDYRQLTLLKNVNTTI